MKRFFKMMAGVVLTVALAIPATTYAQQEPAHFRFGLKVGVNFDKTQGDHLEDDFSGYYLVGAYAGLQSNRFRLQIEGLLAKNTITTGAGFKDAFSNYLSEEGKALKQGTFSMNEFSVPIVAAYNIIPKLIWIEAGPQYTAIVSMKDVDGFVKDAKDIFKSGYVSGLIGGSVDLPLGFNVGLRYVFGLSDRNGTDIPDHWRSSHIQLSAGFTF